MAFHRTAVGVATTAIFVVLLIVCSGTKAKQPQGRYFNHGGVMLYAETTGNMAAGPVMIFLHGSAGNASSWDGVVSKYKNKYSTVAFTLRGTGLSDKPYGPSSNSPYSFVMFSEDVYFVLQELGVTSVICFGQNYGTNICHQLEYDHGDTIHFAASIGAGGNPLTVAATTQPSLTPGAAAWEFLEFSTAVHGFVCNIIASAIAAPGNPTYMNFLETNRKRVYCDRCDNLDAVGNILVTLDSMNEDKNLQQWKLGCGNPAAWPFNEQFNILPVLANRWTPRLLIAGSENAGFSRQYTYYLATKLTPTVPRPGAPDAFPNGYSTPLLRTAVGHGNFVSTTDIETFTGMVDELLKYMDDAAKNVLRKCDVVKI